MSTARTTYDQDETSGGEHLTPAACSRASPCLSPAADDDDAGMLRVSVRSRRRPRLRGMHQRPEFLRRYNLIFAARSASAKYVKYTPRNETEKVYRVVREKINRSTSVKYKVSK